MKIKLMGFFTAVICLASAGGLAVAQVGNCQSCYSSPQNQAYESVGQPVYYDGYQGDVSYGSTVTYQSPVIESQHYQSPTYYPEQVVSQSFGQSFGSGQVIYADQHPTQVAYADSYPSYPTQVVSTGQPYQQPIQNSVSPVTRSVHPTTAYSGSAYTSTNPQPGLAQQKATQAAQMSFRNHIGGSLGGANFEGVGWSNQSAQTAIQNCCYWGQRAPAQIGVSKSPDGCWYACVLYH